MNEEIQDSFNIHRTRDGYKELKCGKGERLGYNSCEVKAKVYKKANGGCKVTMPEPRPPHTCGEVDMSKRKNCDYIPIKKSLRGMIQLDLKTQAMKQAIRGKNKLPKEATNKRFAGMLHRERVKAKRSSEKLTVQELRDEVNNRMQEPEDKETPYVMDAVLQEDPLLYCVLVSSKAIIEKHLSNQWER